MTNSEVHFHESGGKKPARLLFCEFIDNSIEALRRQGGSRQLGTSVIEIHLIFSMHSGHPVRGSYSKLQARATHLRARTQPVPRASGAVLPLEHNAPVYTVKLPAVSPRTSHRHRALCRHVPSLPAAAVLLTYLTHLPD